MWWIYKCNARNLAYQGDWGDWNNAFEDIGRETGWGSTREHLRGLEKARAGDTIIALQSDRKELVGLAKVIRWRPDGRYQELVLKPTEPIRAQITLLKKDPLIRRIPALQGGPVATLYDISDADAQRLVEAARLSVRVDSQRAADQANRAQRGAGFGTAEENRTVEQAAVGFVERRMHDQGWRVRDVSKENRGYDLECTRRKECRHVEVKGSRSTGRQFIITANEKRTWITDRHYVLALVTRALGRRPDLEYFNGRRGLKQFAYQPISFIATPV